MKKKFKILIMVFLLVIPLVPALDFPILTVYNYDTSRFDFVWWINESNYEFYDDGGILRINYTSVFNITDNETWIRKTEEGDLNVNDSDFLDGLNSSQFLRTDENDTLGAFYLYPNGSNPASGNFLVNKEYVDTALEGVEFDFFFTNISSDISGYFLMNSSDSERIENSISSSALDAGNSQILFNISTASGEPVFNTLSAGSFNGHMHLAKSGGVAKTVTVYWELFERYSNQTETSIIISEDSVGIGSKTPFDLHGFINSDYSLNDSDSRLVFRLYADVTGGGGAATILLYTEGTTNSHLATRTTSGFLNDIYFRLDANQACTGTDKFSAFTDGTFTCTADQTNAVTVANLVNENVSLHGRIDGVNTSANMRGLGFNTTLELDQRYENKSTSGETTFKFSGGRFMIKVT